MKKVILFSLLAVLTLGMATGCNKTKKPVVSVEVTGITAQSATVSVTIKGDEPGLVRLSKVTEISEIDFTLDNENAVANFASKNGDAIGVPYSATITGLEPYSDYVICVACYDSEMVYASSAYAKFQTASPDNAINEGGNGAGSVIDREL